MHSHSMYFVHSDPTATNENATRCFPAVGDSTACTSAFWIFSWTQHWAGSPLGCNSGVTGVLNDLQPWRYIPRFFPQARVLKTVSSRRGNGRNNDRTDCNLNNCPWISSLRCSTTWAIWPWYSNQPDCHIPPSFIDHSPQNHPQIFLLAEVNLSVPKVSHSTKYNKIG